MIVKVLKEGVKIPFLFHSIPAAIPCVRQCRKTKVIYCRLFYNAFCDTVCRGVM